MSALCERTHLAQISWYRIDAVGPHPRPFSQREKGVSWTIRYAYLRDALRFSRSSWGYWS